MPSERDQKLVIEQIPIGSLRLDPQNPRQHNARQIGQIARSIESFGFNVPVLVDRDNKVLAGHGRVLALQRLGRSEAPIIRLEHLTPAQAKAFNIADNRLTEAASWNDRLLGEVLQELSAQNLDFSIEATGFSVAEIDLRIEGLSGVPPSASDPADEQPPLAVDPVTHSGDVWQLGRHRLLCGSALERASYQALMRDDIADLVFTDPPFNVKIDGHATGNGKIRHREFAMAVGEMTSGEFTDFLSRVFTHVVRHSTSGSMHYICMDWRHQLEILTAGNEAYTELKNLCIWVKNGAGMGSLYRSRHELVFVFKHGTGKHRNNIELGRHGRHRSNVWEYPGVNSFGRKGEEGDLLAIHPTVKPVAMVADAILDCSARGDVILDPFLGSGTTLMAAERVGRIGRGMEIDPLYVDAAIRRWQRYTGELAIHADTGQRFNDAETAPKEATSVEP
jgi:DNA modification methylase